MSVAGPNQPPCPRIAAAAGEVRRRAVAALGVSLRLEQAIQPRRRRRGADARLAAAARAIVLAGSLTRLTRAQLAAALALAWAREAGGAGAPAGTSCPPGIR